MAAKKKAGKEGGSWAAVFSPRKKGEVRYWLVKSEPDVFSYEDLERTPGKTSHWDGVRNFVARNFLRDGMKLGDQVFFYHSGTDTPAIVGVCEVVKEAYPDPTATDPKHDHFDEDSDPENPRWFMVDLRAVSSLPNSVTLAELRAKKELAGMALLRIGRLSVSPVSAQEWKTIQGMAKR